MSRLDPALLTSDRARPQVSSYNAVEPTLIVVPTYDERNNIEELVSRVFSSVENVHLLVVDGNSPDGTADCCEQLSTVYPDLRILKHEGREGLGKAYTAGFRYALDHGYRIVGSMDADLSHDPAYLPDMLRLAENHDVVIGSRYIWDGGTINWPIWRILLSRLANKYAEKLLRIPAHDLTSGFRIYRREILERVRPEEIVSTGYSFLVEMLYRSHRSGARIAELPIVFYDRTLGESKLQMSEIYKGAYRLLILCFLSIGNEHGHNN